MKEKLKVLLHDAITFEPEVKLSSGLKTDIYVDARLVTMSPEGQSLIGQIGLREVSVWYPDSVGGLTLGADPIAYSIAHASANEFRTIRSFTIRAATKKHGTNKRIEGPFREGDNVVVVEDVITTGKSAIEAINAVREAGGNVRGVWALVDREAGGLQKIESMGLEMKCLFTLTELV